MVWPAQRAPGSLKSVDSEETFDLAAAGLRADGAELRVSVQALASKLESALPGGVHVERAGGGLLGRGEKHVRLVRVDLGETCYELRVEGTGMQGSRERKVGGISIKREALDPQAWIAALGEDLQTQAQRSEQARAALEGLLG
jgi:hypothetical protein